MRTTHADTNGPCAEPSRRPRRVRLAASAGAVLLAIMLIAGWGQPGHAAVPQDDPFAGLEVLGAAEMAEKRGGFFDAVLGLSLSLGANIFTTINGQLVLHTHINFANPNNPHFFPATENLTGLTFLDADGDEIADGGIVSQAFSETTVISVPGGPEVTVPAGFQGLVAMSDSGGIVAAVAKVTEEQFANLVINANAVDPSNPDPLVSAVEQELNITIDVAGFAGLQQNIQLNATLTKFRDAMRAASLGALGMN